jgi:ligand-binding sensor domain-containing protein
VGARGCRILRLVAAAAAAVSVAAPASALRPDKALTQYVRDVWQTPAGLPQNSLLAIAQTADGYLWLGTEEGLARFDGVRFTVFDRSTSPALPSPNAMALLAARDGRLWVGTYGGGLIVFDGKRFKAFGPQEGLAGGSVFALAEDAQGGLWVGTDRGLSRLQGERLVSIPIERAGMGVKSLLWDSQGSLWVATDQGLTRARPGPPRRYSEQDGLPQANITGLHEDGQGVLWVATGRGLARREGDRFVTYTPRDGLADDFVSAVTSDAQGALWIGTNGGLQRMRQGRFETLRASDGLPTNDVLQLLVDREGSVWVGTRGGGLVCLKEGDFTTLGRRQGFATDIVDSIHGSRSGALWIGGSGGHLARLEPDGRIEALPTRAALSGSNIRALYEDPRGDLWIGTWLGLYRRRGGNLEARPAPGLTNVRVIDEDRAGALWVGTDSSGLFRFQGDSVRRFTTRNGLPSDHVRAIHQDAQGRLWIGTYGGLARVNGDSFENYTTAQGLPSDLVRTLYEDAEGALWIGTYGGGLARLKDGRVEAWGTPDGLYNDVAYTILEDASGNLWMSTNRGVYRVSRRDLEARRAGRIPRVRSVAYGESDGMGSEECNGGDPAGWRTADGRLWFLTVRGVSVVDPARLRSARRPPPAVLEQVLLDGSAVDNGSATEVAAGRRSLEFHYTALDLADAARLRFRYRLVGFDSAWTEVGGRRVAYFTGLPPGRYRFEVTASLDGETWTPAAAAHAFRVQPRFYQTRTFVVLAVLGAVSLGLALQQLRVRRMRARAAELKREVEAAVAQVKVLNGLLPICAWCKHIRDDKGYWNEIETYIRGHSEADFTHGICPACAEKVRLNLAG